MSLGYNLVCSGALGALGRRQNPVAQIVIACGSQKYLKSNMAKVIKIELKIVPQNKMIGNAS